MPIYKKETKPYEQIILLSVSSKVYESILKQCFKNKTDHLMDRRVVLKKAKIFWTTNIFIIKQQTEKK